MSSLAVKLSLFPPERARRNESITRLILVARFVVVLSAFSAYGQTLIDLSTQTKNVDFTGQPYTRPMATGTALPSTCTVGDIYFNIAAPAGANLNACTATNTWTTQGSSNSGGGILSGPLVNQPVGCNPGTLYIATDQPAGQQLDSCSAPNTWTPIVSLGGSGALAFTNGSLDIVPGVVPTLGAANIFAGSNSFGGTTTLNRVATGTASNTDFAGQLTLTNGSATYNFAGTYASTPICTASDTTAANAVQVSATTTTLTIVGTGVDVINYVCVARN